MDDASSLEDEFEQDLLLEPEEPPPASTPRQRLEDARAMADGNDDVSFWSEGGFAVPENLDGGGEEPDTSMHLLQVRSLSCKSLSRRSLTFRLCCGWYISLDQQWKVLEVHKERTQKGQK